MFRFCFFIVLDQNFSKQKSPCHVFSRFSTEALLLVFCLVFRFFCHTLLINSSKQKTFCHFSRFQQQRSSLLFVRCSGFVFRALHQNFLKQKAPSYVSFLVFNGSAFSRCSSIVSRKFLILLINSSKQKTPCNFSRFSTEVLLFVFSHLEYRYCFPRNLYKSFESKDAVIFVASIFNRTELEDALHADKNESEEGYNLPIDNFI